MTYEINSSKKPLKKDDLFVHLMCEVLLYIETVDTCLTSRHRPRVRISL